MNRRSTLLLLAYAALVAAFVLAFVFYVGEPVKRVWDNLDQPEDVR